ncbi:hypothetical protein K474DRAFT_510158 [Panus rudis PR-1116 ss-1]|nr:hypothetical protein K474DRAFT_510158 [Panus rudis PR-1116 ss-1]
MIDAESPSSTMDVSDFEILKESPMLGDGKYKLEIGWFQSSFAHMEIHPGTTAKTTSTDPSSSTIPIIKAQQGSLSLFVTNVMLEYAHADYEIYTSMFAAIKCQDDRVGERGARAHWAWEYWQNEWVFREDSEVWECPLPPLSVLLENPRIRETDSFVICIQIHSPVGPFFPQQPSAVYVPRDLLDGLEASLDNSNTGDVQFICLERRDSTDVLEASSASPVTETPLSCRSTSSSAISHTVARKRIIYAHSDILIRRSDYFATMLNSSFAENRSEPRLPGERKLYTVVVEEADFDTVYWLLKWVYANWLLFKESDDPKAAVEGVGAGWSAKSIHSTSTDEWEWRPFHKGELGETVDTGDNHSATSAESVTGARRKSSSKGKQTLTTGPHQTNMRSTGGASTGQRVPTTSATASKSPSSTRPPPSPTRRAGTTSTMNTSALNIPMSSANSPPSVGNPKPIPVPIVTANSGHSAAAHYPVSPRQQRQRSRTSPVIVSDPHPHPTPPPPPASALSMYQVAHRYAMPGLAALALEHMMSTITPTSSFALLLATSAWDELHTLVEDYVVEKWEEVSVSPEFEQCCQEVAAGEWGPEGGKTMMALFRRLRSPSSASYNRA